MINDLHDFRPEHVTNFSWWQNSDGSAGGRVGPDTDLPPNLYIARSATVQAGVVIHEGVLSIPNYCVIGKNALIESQAILKDHCHIGADCYIGARSIIEDFAILGPNVEIGENSRIGPCTQIFSSCDIDDNSRIGSHCILRNNALVGKNCHINDHAIIGQNAQILEGAYIDQKAYVPNNVVLTKGSLMVSMQVAGLKMAPLTAVYQNGQLSWFLEEKIDLPLAAIRKYINENPAIRAFAPDYAHFINSVLSHPRIPADTTLRAVSRG